MSPSPCYLLEAKLINIMFRQQTTTNAAKTKHNLYNIAHNQQLISYVNLSEKLYPTIEETKINALKILKKEFRITY